VIPNRAVPQGCLVLDPASQDVRSIVRDRTGGYGVDVLLEMAGHLGISGRKMFQTWYQMTALLKAGKLELHPVITNRRPISEFRKCMELLNSGKASKILLYNHDVDRAA
jgi:threonine dehydrogenase-like Zn-dependent dehydrogenase